MAKRNRRREAFEQKREADLAAVRTAIAATDFEEAKRLLGAVSLNTLPASRFSKEIGDLYFELGFEAMAGRYWYLVEQKSDVMIAACDAFEHSLGEDPCLLGRSLGWDLDPSPYAKAKLEELNRKAAEFRREYQYPPGEPSWLGDRVALIGCAIVGFIFMSVFLAGITFIARGFR
jgi:hypothetical protein